ncbi:UDP-glycosyltransferase 74D1 [Cryptomeria japonica]|uniref:UDP-glycosyltransferase 74D1 n=1 Tax=Cryptomeria japonica TaxID=3369 RepID=UPI0027DA82B1|nr:UDP-glycosyltransferase 74D1 [Cryptomeria japonica]
MDMNGGRKRNMKGHVVVISYPATGHTNPMLQFSKNLASRGVIVTFVNFNLNHRKVIQARESLQRLKLDIRFECIPDGLPEDDSTLDSNINPAVFKHMQDNMDGSGLERLIHRLHASGDTPPVCCIIYNSFLPWVRDVANKLNIPQALFWTQSAAVFSIYQHFQNGEGLDCGRMPQNVIIPGLPELKLTDLPSAFMETTGSINYYLRQLEVVKDASWVIANTVYELEPETINSLRSTSLPFLPIGPSIPTSFLQDQNAEDTQVGANPWKAADCMEWLNKKPPLSVVYISFGSILVISDEQIQELAVGIQQSGQNFLWVIRAPPGHDHIAEVLPAGFMEETKERGLVVDWCAQLEVLSHPSVGVFMSHCGWNSTLDALSLGVPMLTLGVWTDQPTNSKFVTDVWKTGLRMRRRDDGIVGRDETERCIRMAMESEEGKQLRNNGLKWRELLKSSASEGGSSHSNLNAFAQEIISKAK